MLDALTRGTFILRRSVLLGGAGGIGRQPRPGPRAVDATDSSISCASSRRRRRAADGTRPRASCSRRCSRRASCERRRSRTSPARPERSVWPASSAPNAATATRCWCRASSCSAGSSRNQSPVTLGDVTPLARLTGEYEVIVVPRGIAVPIAAGAADGVQGAAGGDLVGRRVCRRQRSDSGRPRSPRPSASRRRASTTSRSPAAASRCRRSSAARSRRGSTGWRSLPRRSRRARCGRWPSRAASACPVLTCRRCASRASTSSSRTGARWWRRPGLDRGRPGSASRRRSERWCSRRRGARRSSGTAGSIGIWRATRSHVTWTRKRRACAPS